MDTKGGRISLTMNGRNFSARAKATFDPSQVEIVNGVNEDGTGYSTVRPQLVRFELTFDRGPKTNRWDASMLLGSVDMTFKEDDVGVTHLITQGNWEGKPSIDTETGEVSGLAIVGDKYQQTAR